jgi:arylsulfatase A-like enzyme
VICDTARADAFRPWDGPHPTPTMEMLCRQGTWYARAVAAAPWTLPSTASILSGVLPTEHGVTGECFDWTEGRPSTPSGAVAGHSGPWLPELMADRGYSTWGASCNTWVSPWGGFDRGFDRFLDLRERIHFQRRRLGKHRRRVLRVLGKVDRGAARTAREFARMMALGNGKPLFALINLMETHSPYDPPAPYYPYPFWRRPRTRLLSGGSGWTSRYLSMNAGIKEASPEYVETIRSLYFSSARYEDAILGKLLAAIRERDRPTIVVVVADHGENLGEHGLFNHNSSLHETLLRVPFVVWGHRIDMGGGRVDDPISLLVIRDLFSDLAEGRTALPVPSNVIVSEYESALLHTGLPGDVRSRIEGDPSSTAPTLMMHPGVAVQRDRLKYVAIASGESKLFDVVSDPNEEHDLIAQHPEEAEAFASVRPEWERRRSEQPRYEAGESVEGEIEEHLRSLGYLE